MTEWIISSSVLILVLVLLRRVLRGRISLRLQYGLWALVLLRLLLPVSLAESAVSVMNAAGAVPVVQTAELLEDYSDIGYEPSGTVGTGSVTAYYPGDDSQDYPTVIAAEATVEDYERMERVITLRDLIKPLWLCGVGVMLCVFTAANLRFGVKAKKGRRELEVQSSPVPVYISENVHTPCLCGFLRPKIYVTPAAAEDEKTLRHVLAHEGTHYKHRDHIWAVLRCVCLALHWYNPLVWLAAVLSRRDGELACDEGAIRRLGEDERMDYGRTLIRLTCRDRGGVLVTATTMTGSKGTLAERVKLIAKKPHMAAYTLVAVILIAALAVGCTFTGAKSGETDAGETAGPETDWLSYSPDALREMVDLSKDELLASMEESAARDALALRELHPGSFSSSDADELLALFTVRGSPHAAGTDRTVVLLVDLGASEPKAQTTVAGDWVEMSLFQGADGRGYPFFLSGGTWQGLTRYTPLLLEAASDGWVEKEIHESLTALRQDPETVLSYAVTGSARIRVFEVDESGFPPVQPTEQYFYTLEWEPYTACFQLLPEKAA